MFLVSRLVSGRHIEVPVLSDLGLTIQANFHGVSRQEFTDAGVKGVFAGEVSEGEKFGQGGTIELGTYAAMGKQHLDLRSEQQPFRSQLVIKWFDPQPIACDEESLPVPVPDCEGEHAAQVLHAISAVLFVEMNDGFGIAMSAIGVSAGK